MMSLIVKIKNFFKSKPLKSNYSELLLDREHLEGVVDMSEDMGSITANYVMTEKNKFRNLNEIVYLQLKDSLGRTQRYGEYVVVNWTFKIQVDDVVRASIRLKRV